VDQKDHLDLKGHRENKVSVEQMVFVVSPEMVPLDLREILDPEENEDKRESQEKLAMTGPRDLVVTAVVMVKMVMMVSQVQEVKKEKEDLTEKMVYPDDLLPRVNPVEMVLPEQMDDQDETEDPVLRESLVEMGLLVMMVPVDKRESLETLHLDPKESKVPRDREERRENAVAMVSMVQVFPDLMDRKESPEIRSPHQGPKVIKDLLDL